MSKSSSKPLDAIFGKPIDPSTIWDVVDRSQQVPPKVSPRVQILTPCCGPRGGSLKADSTTDEYYCTVCGRKYSMSDMLDLAGAPVKGGQVRMVPVTGNTYPVKDELKLLGARWDNIGRVWKVPESRLIEAQRVVARGPTPTLDQPSPYESPAAQRFKQYQTQAKAAAASRLETRLCWECATPFTEGSMESSWEGFSCGCVDQPRLKK